jgi:GABA(A) receptor-associated protein
MSNLEFKKKYSFEAREAESQKIRDKYPERVPVIVEPAVQSRINKIDKTKFLVPFDLTVGNFLSVIRKRIKLTPEQALFIFVNNTLPCSSQTIGNVYHDYKEKDGFLYLVYTEENTFG